ncbi:MAG: DUF1684 domain-containing protein [Cytophagaceae bacterium]
MKYFFAIICFFYCTLVFSQNDSTEAIKQIKEFQKNLNANYSNPAQSPLQSKDLKKFKGHNFYPINLKYRVTAKLTQTEQEKAFKMPTTTSRLPEYRKYGELHFSIDGVTYKLNVYQSIDLMKLEKYKDYLFLPFTDLTNEKDTYSGGRYIELTIPEGNELILDFNQAYNPYCAYNNKYSCPLVPSENHLNITILAGVKLKK